MSKILAVRSCKPREQEHIQQPATARGQEIADNMKNIIKSFSLFILCVLNFSGIFAQSGKNSTASLTSKIISYGKKNATSSLFTCFDKTVYVNNESVWFTSYLINYSKRVNGPTILSVLLVNDQSGSIAFDQKFEMANGLSFGHAIIPDSVPPGDYSFITYTNILANGIPKDVFIQPITIKSAAEIPFFASLSLTDSTKALSDNNEQVTLTVETKAHIPIKGVTATWDVGVLNGQVTSGRIKTDANGKYLFSVSRDQIVTDKNFLNVRVTYKNEVRNVKMLLPVSDKKLNIRFYPESGNLIDGLVSTIGWEVKTVYGRPLSVNAVLYQNNQAIDTIHTDSYGMGRFKLIPQLGNKYELKLAGYANDVSYALPRILSTGLIISAYKAISDDSLQLKLVSKDPGKFFVMIHNFDQVFYSFPVEVTSAGKKLLINLADLPKGLSTITILDSLLRPCAERIFFAHYNRRSPLSITPDRVEYTTRQKVRIKLKLLSTQSDPIKGVITVACVQSNKIETKKFNDIESYHYLKQELEALPVRGAYMGQSADDKDYLEKVLLIKGWRKYSWQNMASDNAKYSTVDEKPVLISGSVSKYGKPLKKPIGLVVMTDSATKIITTDAKGDFQLNNSNAVTAERRKIHLMLSGGTIDTYAIKMKDSFNMVNGGLINGFKTVNYNLTPVPLISSDSSTIKGLDHVISLKEVKITGRKEDIYNLQPIMINGKNECGDYVCSYGILNCPNHPNDVGNRPPEVGQKYYSASTNGWVAYKGCATIPNGPSTIAVDGINYPKEFYGSDYSLFNPPEPEYQSTIFWKHACFIDSKEIELDFYTSDITGPFSIIVQGVSSNGLIYEKKEFMVNKKK
ncbi:MAG: Ig-like domain-containing protein [Sphingobacteriales bacterium]